MEFEVSEKDLEKIPYDNYLMVGNFAVRRVKEKVVFMGNILEMECVDKFEIVDMFGYIVATGDKQYISGFINGLNGYCEEEEIK